MTADATDAMILGNSRIVILTNWRKGERVFEITSHADRAPVLSPVTDYEDHSKPWFPTKMVDIGETRPKGLVVVVACDERQSAKDTLFSLHEGTRLIDAIEIRLNKELVRETSFASLVEAYYGVTHP